MSEEYYESYDGVEIVGDGDMLCARFDDFDDLQVSPAGFGKTEVDAVVELAKNTRGEHPDIIAMQNMVRLRDDKNAQLQKAFDKQVIRNAALQSQVREMREVVDNLPKTADGVPVTPGMHVWFYSPKPSMLSFIEELKVVGWDHLPGMGLGFMFVLNVVTENGESDGESDGVNLACCFSTREAAIPAKHAPEDVFIEEEDTDHAK